MAPQALELSTREHELSILYEIASIAKQVDCQDQVVALTLDKASRLLGSEVVVFYVFNPERGQLEARAARGVRLKRLAPGISPAPAQIERMISSASGWAGIYNPLEGQYQLKAALSLPLRHSGELLGWLFVGRMKRECFEAQDLALYNVLGEQVSGALHMTLAWEQQRRQQADLEAANLRLAQLVDALSATSQEQERLIATVKLLSTPVLAIDARVLLIPLIGLIDSARAALIQQRMLEAIADSGALVTILDISGVAMVDELIVAGLIQTAQAAGLLGATVIVCGISAEVAQMMVSLGVELRLTTAHNLRAAIDRAFQLVGRQQGERPAGR